MKEKMNLLGYDVGGTKIVVSLGSSDGRLLGSARIENKDTHPEDILPQMVSLSRKLVKDAGMTLKDVRAFGVSCPGPADIPNGIMTAPTNNKYWRNVPLKKYLADNLGIPGVFENDANCGALAEWFFGAGKNCSDFIYLTMSTGIGGGIIAENKLVRGTGFYGGEVGHIVIQLGGRHCNCGMDGCYEAYCGGRAIADRIQEELRNRPDEMLYKLVGGDLDKIDLIVLEKGIRAGDPYSVKLWDEVCLRNAQAFGVLINTFNPRKLVLGTIAWAMGDIFLPKVREYLPRFCWKEMLQDCELVPCALRRDIAAWAGIAAAMYEFR